ncbi:phosphoglycerate kinase [Desulforhabdus amnigena]|jgi:phosphoglycerate kinase|uniref:Phosphoglycerate kinase n=1 Tax=Desulforhabdus amnigena TaxID=40218 RepID=A0A9W6FWH4_9BACT|nr:phosphoglycerate kinase [Desulforhabdus amnigena]NLJ28895.1 phosphoglycerate kinase [Deltaproteobacteria bacterium]GLI36186.1 phosphoglycerate kinase [Desulforhabdus amnigena]
MKTLDTLDLAEKRVFMRVDFNVPLDKQRRVTDDLRIQAVLPSIRKVVDAGGRLILASHLGRPKGKVAEDFSLKPVGEYLSRILGKPVQMAPDCIGAAVEALVSKLQGGEILLLENLRFHAEEEKNDDAFSRQLAALADVYVNDAFAVSHRAHASVHGITRHVPLCAAGYQLENEIKYFHQAMEAPQRPLTMIIGGAKVSSKIGVLENLLSKADHLIIGGAMANTFLKVQGKNVGKSLVEDDHMETATNLLERAKQKGVKVYLPVDAVVAPKLESGTAIKEVDIDNVPSSDLILDVGPKTIEIFKSVLKNSKTIVWNGPLGAFETPPFHKGTFSVAEFLGSLDALTVIGGGDSAAAVRQAGAADKVSYVSTGGGAFLELLEGKTLPGIAALEECSQRS